MADFTTRFNELLARTSVNDTAIAEALGVSKQTISAWKNGTRFPKKPAIRTIAEYFGIGVPWLVGMTDDEQAERESSFKVIASELGSASPTAKRLREIGRALSSAEVELIDIFRDLNETGQQALLGTARGLSGNPDMRKDGASNSGTA